MKLRHHVVSFAICLLSSCATHAAHAGSYPSKPVKIIVQTPAGNGPDVVLRIVADRLGGIWRQQPVIINRPGAGGLLAAEAAVAAEPDGYTLFDAITSTLLVLPVTQNLSFDLNHALLPIAQAGEQPFVIGVSPSLGVSTLPELIALAKSKPGKILYAAAQRGSMPHLASELLRSRADIDIGFVPYPSTTQAVQDIVGGRISVIFEGMSALAGPIKAGWIKPIAVTAPERLPNFPDIPAAAETISGYRASGWFVLMARAGTPDAIVQKLNRDLRSVLGQPELQEKLAKLATYVHPMSVAETAQFIKSEQTLWQPIARKLMVSQ
jgi:tripartite-type tricarboxylate transporter receptor subunit TctC